MSVRQPFSIIPHADFLARVADLEGDEIALFTMAFFQMLERSGPIDDDMGWLGRKAGVSTRRANQIRAKLLDQGKWMIRAGQLGDPEALKIIDKRNRRSAVNRSNAFERWDRDGQPQLDLENEGSGERKRQKTAKSSHANASARQGGGAAMQTGGKNEDK